MTTNLIIVDDIYEDPDEVRNFALNQDFNVKGNYPGRRTTSFLNEEMKEFISDFIRPHAGEVTYWGGDDENGYGYTGAFQLTYASDRTWIHADQTTKWAGLIYLTPNAPHTGGTGLFRHKEKGWYKTPKDNNGNTVMYDHPTMVEINHDFQDYTKWDLVDVIGNVYNRLVLYRGDIFHASLDYFGHTPESGRLFQTFFFSTEN